MQSKVEMMPLEAIIRDGDPVDAFGVIIKGRRYLDWDRDWSKLLSDFSFEVLGDFKPKHLYDSPFRFIGAVLDGLDSDFSDTPESSDEDLPVTESYMDVTLSPASPNNEKITEMENPGIIGAFDGVVSSSGDTKQDVAEVVSGSTKEELVNRLMEEFWTIFNKVPSEWSSTTTSRSSGASSRPPATLATDTAPKTLQDSAEEQGGDGDDSDAAEIRRSAFAANSSGVEFACHFRKRDPLKYNVMDWRSCTLTPHPTSARVKCVKRMTGIARN